MKNYLLRFFVFVLLLYIVLSAPICFASNIEGVMYIDAYDGDTFTVNIKDLPDIFGKNVPVRIAHIDAAEIRSSDPCEVKAALKARELVRDLLKNATTINLVNVKRDKYFRILAEVKADTKDLATIILNAKLAYPYEGEAKKKFNWCTYGKKSK
jgi:endonuclease YncB( thermonuclease family)